MTNIMLLIRYSWFRFASCVTAFDFHQTQFAIGPKTTLDLPLKPESGSGTDVVTLTIRAAVEGAICSRWVDCGRTECNGGWQTIHSMLIERRHKEKYIFLQLQTNESISIIC